MVFPQAPKIVCVSADGLPRQLQAHQMSKEGREYVTIV